MRILIVLDSYPPDLNGGAYFTHRLALALQTKGHDVLVICPSRSFHQGFCHYEGVKLYGVRSWSIFGYKNFRVCWPFFIKKNILKVIKTFSPEVVHLQGKFFLGGIIYRACRKQNMPFMATNHFMPENFFHYTRLPKRFESWFKKYTWGIVTDMLSHAQVVTTPTQTAADLLAQVGLKKTVTPISCGVDLLRFKPSQDASDLRRRFDIPNKPILLYTGRLDKEKKLDFVLKAFSDIRQFIDAHFVMTGQGAEAEHLKKLVQSLNLQESITFTGYLSDNEYPQIFGLANCFVNASEAELQSIVTLEALASGLPLVVVNAMALPELVCEGDNGYLFEPGDQQGLCDALVQILGDVALQKKMGQESRQLALTHDIHKTVEQYESLYQELMTK